MMSDGNYWQKKYLSRRAALRAAAVGGGGLVALSLVGCGGDDEEEKPAASSQPGAEETDYKKGVRGGKLVLETHGDAGTLLLAKARNAGSHQVASLTHSGLYQLRNSRPGVALNDLAIETDLAVALPETPADQLSWIVKITPGTKFQNGRVLTSEDVKYSYERYAFSPDSGYKVDFPWLDSVQAPDPNTVVFKAKYPYADVPVSLAAATYGLILAKEHEEGPDALNKPMGSGPYIFIDKAAPVVNGRYKRNPDYFAQPWPYFDEVEIIARSDLAKSVANFTSKQVHVTYWFDEERRDELKKNRPDAVFWANPFNGWAVTWRTDVPPFNDQRVRQAGSMMVNRKQIIDGLHKGETVDDQYFTWVVKTAVGQFRKPAELKGAKYWKNDPQAAKQLLSAAGVTLPLKMHNPHWDASVHQQVVDLNTLVSTQWRQAGFIDSEDKGLTFAQYASTVAIGNYEGWSAGPSGGAALDPGFGNGWRNTLYTPPGGIQGPSVNNSKINDPRINELITKQLGQFNPQERRASFTEIEDIFSENQFKIVFNTLGVHPFADPGLRGIQLPVNHLGFRALNHVKYWWWKDGKA
jgi:peptide/nickel transport system substrate-binding protein